MESPFKTVPPESIAENVFTMIGTDWMLVTGGNLARWNTMTASWGGMGVLWHKKVCFAFVRPQRYTYEFMENHDFFTLSFFPASLRSVLNYCGSHSGREVDKSKETGIIPVALGPGVSFQQARLAILCKKIYYQDINPNHFLAAEIAGNYPQRDYHRMYIGEVQEAFIR